MASWRVLINHVSFSDIDVILLPTSISRDPESYCISTGWPHWFEPTLLLTFSTSPVLNPMPPVCVLLDKYRLIARSKVFHLSFFCVSALWLMEIALSAVCVVWLCENYARACHGLSAPHKHVILGELVYYMILYLN